MTHLKTMLAIPCYNAGKDFQEVTNRIVEQKQWINSVYIVDSSSQDDTASIARSAGFEVQVIPTAEFSHSATRTMIARKAYESGFDNIIFMTQDVYLQEDAIKNLVNFLTKDPMLAVVRGKQVVDMEKGNYFEYFSRKHNYGESNYIYSKQDIAEKGIDTIYTSDAFSIYRLEPLASVGYFGEEVEYAEDMYAAHKLIQAGFKVGYASDAKVFHTHNYTIKEEYSRYLTTGYFHGENQVWIETYGKVGNKGINLVFGEIVNLLKRGKFYLIPECLVRNGAKFIGFHVGKQRYRRHG